MRAFSLSERKKLTTNPYVIKITEKSISFSNEFKRLMLHGVDDGRTRQQFFNDTLSVNCFDKKYVDSSLNRWRREEKFKNVPKKRGRRKDPNKMTIEELKAELALQKEINAQLKKAQGLTEDDPLFFL
ncbi:hypothetical protein [Peredibacter starrii]|uniref:Transposase n=1 Tax=Peredibacter starrii TaxID=28202 RepID=A0AAX4HLR9_9BACT|nr:hypothetical protein [Peredibacter starrii]WPU63206.1 hypothetical protein SOO65_10970 [Peredibacter starrii]WPU63497.1 hypothetical protein SOO65_12440 [Peredibacter starrii]WPU64068.1 hypothetical protein SOO65_15340 [Peredibacter starrii]WPU64504.1 hypothetical protein SOO65_17560 [Peredibacter starrii]WPU67122.1 hypothetical protein SOO65_10190 [Peredibacter starrii]